MIERLKTSEYGADPELEPEKALSLCAIRYERTEEPENRPEYTELCVCRGYKHRNNRNCQGEDLPGVRIDTVSVRSYETPYAAHILGRIGPIENYDDELKEQGYAMDDYLGIFGAEKAFESYLPGRADESRGTKHTGQGNEYHVFKERGGQ